jgi:hypothetical protein
MTIYTHHRSNTYKISLLFFCIGLLFIFSLNTIFLHTHISPNGKLIAHSHPVSNTGESSAKHEHTNIEYLYHYITGQYDKFILIDAPLGIYVFGKTIFRPVYIEISRENDFNYCSLFRAPPSC